jgi:nucleotide-binding universal stress UspA family protein
MEKILLAIDSSNMTMNAVDFACYLATLSKSRITGVFLENLVLEEKPVLKYLHGSLYAEPIVDRDLPDYPERKKHTQENIEFFKRACENRGVRWNIHRDKGVPKTELIEETRYADLLVISAETSFSKKFEGTPSKFVKGILEKSECPVVISPESFDGVDEILFTYDGSRSSMFALKQFTYLFPEYRNKKATVLEINKSGSATVVEKYKITEWVKAHYTNIGFAVLLGEPMDELFGYMLNKKNIFVVMGSYGRSMLSNIVRPSKAERVLRAISLPVFIAHY